MNTFRLQELNEIRVGGYLVRVQRGATRDFVFDQREAQLSSWVFDRRAKSLRKLGGDAAPSTLMFAKFSPDGSRVAYVQANNVYVESAQTGETIQLTRDDSETIVNGTSDWVYEEEFFLRDAFRWSPAGKRVAYWQFNTSGVRKFGLVYNVGAPYDVVTHIPYPQYGLYPQIKEIPYPEPGTPNSLVRAGVISSDGGATTWLQVPGDPTNSYIARMEWAGDSNTLVLQHLNRLQNTNDVLLADANTGSVQQVYQDHDSTWVDVVDHLQWLHGRENFGGDAINALTRQGSIKVPSNGQK